MATATATALTVMDIFGKGGVFDRHRPGYEERPTQIKLARAIEEAIASRTHLAAEAETGTGKSYAYLVPAILAGEKTVVSTAVLALQEQLRDKDLPTLARIFRETAGLNVTYAVLKGLSNYTCLRNVAKLGEDMFGEGFKSAEAGKAYQPFTEWVRQQQMDGGLAEVDAYPGEMPRELRTEVTTDSDGCTGQKCPFWNECFGRQAKDRAADAQIIVVNHALLLRDSEVRAATGGHAAALPDYSTLVIDEAHNLESIARDQLATEMSPGRLTRLVKGVERLTTEHKAIKVKESLNQGATEQSNQAHEWVMKVSYCTDLVLGWLDFLKERMNEDGQQRLGDERGQQVSPEDPTIDVVGTRLQELAAEMRDGTPAWLEDEERDQWKKLSAQVGKVAGALKILITPGNDDEWIRYASLERSNGREWVKLAAKPIDVASILAERFFDDVTIQRVRRDKETGESVPVGEEMPPLVVIATSATIATDGNVGVWRERCGMERASELLVGSPFDYARNARTFVPDNAYAFEPKGERNGREAYESYLEDVADAMAGLTLDAKGGAFLLFTSAKAMRETHRRILPRLERAGLRVMMQGEMSRTEMVRIFKEDGNAVLLGLKSFWEGVDVPGDALRLVVIDKLPFNPPTDVVWAALCEHINRKRNNEWAWWDELAIPFMQVMLKQGYGRLIRTMTDRGIVALLDGRLRTKGYGKRILRSLPQAPVIGTADEVSRFWTAGR